MNKSEYLKTSKTFLKMAELDLAAMKFIRTAKLLLNAALIINSAAFAFMLFFGAEKVKN